MNQLPLELIYVIGCKVRGKSLYDYKQIGKFISDLNLNDPYIEIIKDNEFIKKTLYKNKIQSINGESAYETIDGNKWWYHNNKLHRIDGPAFEKANGDKHWYLLGKKHREDGPAVDLKTGDKIWYHNGQLHRIDGPAAEWSNGDKWWYKDGLKHKENGPAVEWSNGDKMWFKNDMIEKVTGFNENKIHVRQLLFIFSMLFLKIE
jgi:hypothetical protein